MKKTIVNYKNKKPNKINKEIRSLKVKLVGEHVQDNNIVYLNKALEIASNLNLDLVEVSSDGEYSVCKFLDYSKYLYKKEKNKKKSKKITTKEIRFRPTTGENDFTFKKNNIEKFLKNGDNVKAYVMFKGREMNYKKQGEEMLLKLAVDLENVGVAENMPKMEGYRMSLFLKPKKTKKTSNKQ